MIGGFVRSVLVLAGVALAAGCGSGGSAHDASASDAAAQDAAPLDATVPVSTIRGVSFNTYHPVTGEGPEEPWDLRHASVMAFVPSGDGWRWYSGLGTDQGTFEIHDVPEVEATIKFGVNHAQFAPATFVVTAGRELDFGYDIAGRERPWSFTFENELVLTVNGLEPWQPGHSLMLFSPDVDEHSWPLNVWESPPPAGTTFFADYVIPLGVVERIDAAVGDVATLIQYGATTTAMGEITSPVRAGVLSPFTLASGQSTPATGMLLQIPETGLVELAWDMTAFAAQAPHVHPSSIPIPSGALGIFSLRVGTYLEFGRYIWYLTLPVWHLAASTGDEYLDLGTVPIRNPFPADWPLAVYASYEFAIEAQLPGAAPMTRTAWMLSAIELEEFGMGPVTPLVGPVGAPQIDGMDAFATLEGVGLSPTISWSPPEIGTATAYRIDVWEIGVVDGITEDLSYPASIVTSETQVKIPPGVLYPDSHFIARITALHTSVDLTTHPFRYALPFARADSFTGVFSP